MPRRITRSTRVGLGATLSSLLLTVAFGAEGRAQGPAPVEAVASVDLDRYSGLWYEIARLPNRFQKKCACCVTATYTLRDSGHLSVVNQCQSAGGERDRVEGKGRLAEKDGPTSKLEVRFAPAFLSFLGAVWGDYWVLELAEDYSYALVGSPDRRYLWVLAREPALDEQTFESLMGSARRMGFDVAAIERTPQD